VNGARRKAVLRQHPFERCHIALAVAEDDRVLHLVVFDDLLQQVALVIARCLHEHLLDARARRRGACHLDAGGIVQEGIRQPLNFGRHGGGEKQRLPREGKLLADFLDVGNEAHIEHAVGFVDHENLHAGQEHLAASAMIEQPAWRCDQNVDAAVELLFLVAERNTADQKRHRELVVLAIGLEILGNLCGEFACRFENERARHPRLGTSARQLVDHRQRETGRLAGARLGDAEHVASGQYMGNGFRLNRRRFRVAGFGYSLQYLRREAEVFKFHMGCPVTPLFRCLRWPTFRAVDRNLRTDSDGGGSLRAWFYGRTNPLIIAEHRRYRPFVNI